MHARGSCIIGILFIAVYVHPTNLEEPKCAAPPSKVPERSSSADMRPDSRLKLKSECFAINRLQLLEYEYHTALDDLKKVRKSINNIITNTYNSLIIIICTICVYFV